MEAWTLLLAVDLSLRLLPFYWVQKLAVRGRRVKGGLAPTVNTDAVQRLRLLVGTAARNHVYPMRCLPRSLVLQWLLGRRGIVANLRIGVRKEEGDLRAHAWLEHGGVIVGEPQAIPASFVPLAAGKESR